MGRNKREILIFLFWLLVAVNILWFGSRLIDYKINGEETPGEVKIHSKAKESTFYYEQLSDVNKESYEILKQGMVDRNSNIVLENCSEDELQRIWYAVLMDCPEIFWVNSYRYSVQKGETVKCEVLPDYCYTKDEITERQTRIQEITEEFMTNVSKDESDYNKILYTYEYIIEQTEYDDESENNQHIDSVFIGKGSVCAGYAKTTKYLLNQLGVECIYVRGQASGSSDEQEPHAWTIVKCEDDYYYVDTTWGDPIYQAEDNEESEKYSNITYDYMCCNDEQLFKTHTLDTLFEYPSCVKNDWNYYVVNGRYFTEYDSEIISELIKKDIEEKKVYSEFKFADSNVYKEAKEDLLENQVKKGKDYFNEVNGKDGSRYYYKDIIENNKIAIYWE